MIKKILSVLATATIIGVLLIGVNDLPEFGNPNNPEHNELSRGYIENTLDDTGAKNIVSAVILDYRALDTFIESTVLFSGAIVVLATLMKKEDEEENE